MEAFSQILSNFGFPVALSIYLLVRFEKILDSVLKSNQELVVKNLRLIEEVGELKGLLEKRRR